MLSCIYAVMWLCSLKEITFPTPWLWVWLYDLLGHWNSGRCDKTKGFKRVCTMGLSLVFLLWPWECQAWVSLWSQDKDEIPVKWSYHRGSGDPWASKRFCFMQLWFCSGELHSITVVTAEWQTATCQLFDMEQVAAPFWAVVSLSIKEVVLLLLIENIRISGWCSVHRKY